MLTQVADRVLVHESTFCRSNAVVVQGREGVLLIDAGIRADELTALAQDLIELDLPVVAGFSTHPHWDHLLWHADLGAPPRYATARGAAAVGAVLSAPGWRDRVAGAMPPDLVDDVPLDLFGLVTALPDGATELPWDGPRVRVVEHAAHAQGSAALVIEESRVLVAGDLVSDVLVPMLDLRSAAPIETYLAALQLLETAVLEVDAVVPGHGSPGTTEELHVRIGRDRAYLQALRAGQQPHDPRIGETAQAGWEWVAGVHEHQRQQLAARGEPEDVPA